MTIHDEPRDISFLFVGNHACLDFVNTTPVIEGQRIDLLSSFPDLLAWLREADLWSQEERGKVQQRLAGEAEAQQILEQAQAFRATLREMVERIADGKAVSHTPVDAINELLQYRRGHPTLIRHKDTFTREFQMGSDDAHQLLGLLAEAATDLLCTCDLSLIKKCQNPECVLFFYDTTKNHARHWCSMSLCGNRSKVAAHYHRHRRKKR